MSQHSCIEFDPNCFRCDLNRDEIEALKSEDRADAATAFTRVESRSRSRRDIFIAGFMAGREC